MATKSSFTSHFLYNQLMLSKKTIIAKKNVPHIYVKDKNYRCVWDSLGKKLMIMIIP